MSIEGQGHFLTLPQGRVHTKIQTGFSQKLLCRSEPNFYAPNFEKVGDILVSARMYVRYTGFQAGPTFPTIPTFPYFFVVLLLFPTFL